MKTITYNPETHVLVPIEPSEEMYAAANKIDDDMYCGGSQHGADIDQVWNAFVAAAPQPEPNHNWCARCSPDNCSGCGAEPGAYIFKPNNELLWPNEVDQNVFASDPEDYDLLYTNPPSNCSRSSRDRGENGMTNDEILQAAKEAGLFTRGNGYYAVCHKTQIERFAAIIEKRTIERCADYVNEVCTYGDTHLLVKAIRKLGEQ